MWHEHHERNPEEVFILECKQAFETQLKQVGQFVKITPERRQQSKRVFLEQLKQLHPEYGSIIDTVLEKELD